MLDIQLSGLSVNASKTVCNLVTDVFEVFTFDKPVMVQEDTDYAP